MAVTRWGYCSHTWSWVRVSGLVAVTVCGGLARATHDSNAGSWTVKGGCRPDSSTAELHAVRVGCSPSINVDGRAAADVQGHWH